mgnify:FL=1
MIMLCQSLIAFRKNYLLKKNKVIFKNYLINVIWIMQENIFQL